MVRVWVPNLLLAVAVVEITLAAPLQDTGSRLETVSDHHSVSRRAVDLTGIISYVKAQALKTDKQVAKGQYPHGGKCTTCPDWAVEKPKRWVSGFFPGILLLLAANAKANGNTTEYNDWMSRARARMDAGLREQAFDTTTHDVGMKIFPSFGQAFFIEGQAQDKQTVLDGAATLIKRFNPTVGAIKSWDTEKFKEPAKSYAWPVVIDNIMNLEILFWAAANGGSAELQNVATKHAETSLRDLVRSDGCVWHLVNYNPQTGKLLNYTSVPQGFNNTSTWTRGQAFGIYGFGMVYKYTKNPKFLAAAENVAKCYLARLAKCCSKDYVPPFDFDYPNGFLSDSSAGAITSVGLLQLSQLTGKDTYKAAAIRMIEGLTADYLSKGKNSNGVLLGGMGDFGKVNEEVPLIYGDYYYLQALLRLAGKLSFSAMPGPTTSTKHDRNF